MSYVINYSNGSSKNKFLRDNDKIIVVKTSNGDSLTIDYELSYTFEEFLAVNSEFTDSKDFEQQFIKITSYETVREQLCVKSFEMFGTEYYFNKPLKIFNKHHVSAPLHYVFKFNFDNSLASSDYGRPYVILNPIKLNNKSIVKKYYDISQRTSDISEKLANRCEQYKALRIIQKKRPLTEAQETNLNNLKRNILRENPNILLRIEFMIWIC